MMNPYNYFQSYKGYFWQWEEDAEVIAFPNGNTIAYRGFIAEIIDSLRAQGLPPFGSLLLSIVATNPGGRSTIDDVYRIVCDALKTTDDVELSHAAEFLNLLSEVPEEYKQGRKRMLLLQAIFENCHNRISIKKSQQFSSFIGSKMLDIQQLTLPKKLSIPHLRKDFKTLTVLKNKFQDVQDIMDKIIALPVDPQELIQLDEQPATKETKELTEQLVDNPKTFHVGSLIKHIWSGLNIPLHSSLPSQQPLGGVADLTNKGDFDKLLISEFANEDLIFLSRLANNEALYIHREIPPASNKLERIILIDVSLKNWGIPKAVSFATMLAIAKHPKTDIACTAFTVGDTYHPVSIKSVDTILEGIQLLEGSLHAANGLDAFFKDHPALKNQEIFFITEHSTLRQAAMAKAMSDHQSFINYLIFTDNTGNIDIYKKQQNSRKHIQHLQLPLEKLWKKSQLKPVPGKESEKHEGYYPFLMKCPQNIKTIMKTSDGQLFIVTGDKSLLRFFDSTASLHTKGWEMLIETLPFANREFEMGVNSHGEYILLMFNPSTRELILHNLATGEKKSHLFPGWKLSSTRSFIFYNNTFYHCNDMGYWTFDFNFITRVPEDRHAPTRSVLENHTENLKKLVSTHKRSASALKNVRQVYINEQNKLVFNHHTLSRYGSQIMLNMATNERCKIQAERKSDSEFIFPDGSCVEINKRGLFILKSSGDLPPIYLSSFLDTPVAAGTNTLFAGNEFHYPNCQFDVYLKNSGEKQSHVVAIVDAMTTLDLIHLEDLVQRAPCKLLSNVSEEFAEKLKKQLEDHGATIEIHPVTSSVKELQIVSVEYFYQSHIEPFIAYILNHGV